MSVVALALADAAPAANFAEGEHVGVSSLFERSPSALLARARERAADAGLPYAGGLYPDEAWSVCQAGSALLVDVRTAEERKFVGRVPDSLHVAWMTGTAMIRNPRFLRDLEKLAAKDATLLLLCRSGNRSAAAAAVATAAGFSNVFNVLEGFEGNIDDQRQRGDNGGWRFRGLPWIQD